jgi:ABC-type branched-subunit amino acid transport system ATPase component
MHIEGPGAAYRSCAFAICSHPESPCLSFGQVNSTKVESLAPLASFMGYVPQDDILHENLTVEENLM